MALSTIRLGENGKQVKQLRALVKGKARRGSGKFIVEGEKSVSVALAVGFPLEGIYFTHEAQQDGKAARLAETALGRNIPLFSVSARVMRDISEVVSPQGVLAVAPIPAQGENLHRFAASKKFLVLLDGIQDAGNVGTIIRTSLAAGVDGLILTKGCADPYAAKVVRGSAGAIFELPLFCRVERGTLIRFLGSSRREVYGTVPRGGRNLWECNFSEPLVLLLGGEGTGLVGDMMAACKHRVTVPMKEGTDSLNVAVAFGIVAMEISRRLGVLRS